jgi:hypothetical protein
MPLARPVRGRPRKADGYTDRATGPDAVRHASVDTATHRLTVTRRDTRRDKKETAPGRVSAARGPFPQVVAGVGFEPT